MHRRRTLVLTVGVLGCLAAAAPADSAADRFARLVAAPGVSAREDAVRDLVRSLLPAWATPEVDELGNLVLSFGSGQPSTLVVAALDEDGYVVSGITADGFIRLHRPTREPQHRLFDQFHVGQPVVIQTRRNGLVPGVTATPSTHLRRYLPADDATQIRGLEDLWVDVGASTRLQVDQLGVRMLDAVTLRDRAQVLARGLVAGPAAQGRAGTLALLELVRAWPAAPAVTGTLTIAWTSQSLFGARGLARLVVARRPDQVIACGLALPARGKEADPRGGVGLLGGGALIAAGDAGAADAALQAGVTVQAVAADRLQVRRPSGWDGQVRVLGTPVLFAQTPVETVDVRDALALARLLAGLTGTPAPVRTDDLATAVRSTGPPARAGSAAPGMFDTLKPLIESYGVSGHEARPREAVLRLLPLVAPWARPTVDERGNVLVTIGAGGDEMVFVAHTDELGYEITAIRDDGTAAVRARGGMYDSLYEAHPVLVHSARGDVPAVLAPRAGYVGAEAGPPRIEDLVIYFGASSAAEVQALGVTAGDTATVPKQLVKLAGDRATARAMDDRAGCAVLLMALAKIDPARAARRVTFVWSVQEETGLVGAAYVAARGRARYAFAVDTFVSTDSPFDTRRLADIPLGSGAVLRGMDNSTATPPAVMDRMVELAGRRAIPMTIGVTAGGTDASAFSRYGAIDVGLSWPGRYSHSPVEVTDLRDLDALVSLVTALVLERW